MSFNLFDPGAGKPTRDIWSSEQLRTMAAEGYYWTPEGLRNGPYKKPETPAPEEAEPARARPRRIGPSRKKVIA